MAVGDLYKVVVRSSVYGVQCENAWWYRQRTATTSGTGHDALLLGFDVEYVGNIVDLMAENDTQVDGVDVWNYTDGVGFATSSFAPELGTVEGVAANSQYCVGIRMARVGVGWNYPRKRISGIPLFYFSDNGILASAVTAFTDLFNSIRVVGAVGAAFDWIVIRPDTGFELGNPDIIAEGNVGGVNLVYDATQNTRRT